MSTPKKLIATFALLLACLALASPAASASYTGIGSVNLVTDGGTDVGGADWVFYVTYPSAVGTSAAYWNLTIYADYLNASATNATYYVIVSIGDGSTTVSENRTVAAKNDKRVYANASFPNANYTGMNATYTGTYTLSLLNSTYDEVDNYTGTIYIYADDAMASAIQLIYVMIPVAVLMVVINLIRPGKKLG